MRHAVLALLALLALPALSGTALADPRPVRVQTAAYTELHPTLTYSGTVQDRHLAELGFRVGGKIVARPIEIGDRVRQGQVLARLDPADLALSAAQAARAADDAAAVAAQARADLARYERLGTNSPSYIPSEYDRRLAASRSADAKLAEAAQQLSLARDQLAYATLRADADGVITALPVEIGQVVTAGQTVATLAHAGETEIWVDIPENRLADLHGATVTVTPWSDPDRHLAATVREVGALADPLTRTFRVKLALADATGLSLGMTATVAVAPRDHARAILLPASALTDRDGAPAVWILGPDGHPRLHQVTLARLDGAGHVAIAAGLVPGERVITAGADLIDPDMHLAAWSGPNR